MRLILLSCPAEGDAEDTEKAGLEEQPRRKDSESVTGDNHWTPSCPEMLRLILTMLPETV